MAALSLLQKREMVLSGGVHTLEKNMNEAQWLTSRVGPLVNERAHSSTSGGGKRGWVGLPRWAESAWEFSFFLIYPFYFFFFVFFLISVLKFYSVHIELCIELLIKVQIQNTKSSMYTIYSYTFILNVLSIYLGKTFQI